MKYKVEWWEERIYLCKAIVEAQSKEDAEVIALGLDEYKLELKEITGSGINQIVEVKDES